MLRKSLQEPVPHEERGLERHAAACGALAQREHVDEALRVCHPGAPGQLARREDLSSGLVEGAPAVPAEVTLFAMRISTALRERRRVALWACDCRFCIGATGRIFPAR